MVPVVLLPHGNADSLSVVQVWGYTCVVRTEDWRNIDRAAYIVPDTLVPTEREEFKFLAADAYKDGMYRVRAKRHDSEYEVPHCHEGFDAVNFIRWPAIQAGKVVGLLAPRGLH